MDIPETSSEDRLEAIVVDLLDVLKKPHPPTPFINQGDKTTDAMRKLKEIFQPPQTPATKHDGNVVAERVRETEIYPAQRVDTAIINKDIERRRSQRVAARLRGTESIQEEDEIGTVVKKKFGDRIHTGKVIRQEGESYCIKYSDGDTKTITQSQLDKYKYVKRKGLETIQKRTRSSEQLQQANTVIKNTTIPLPRHYANAVYDEETVNMLEFKKLLTHKEPET